MDERNWLWFSVTTFFAFVVISYVRESKLVFLVEKYSNQLENMQNYTDPKEEPTLQLTQPQSRQLTLNSPNVKIYKIPAHLPDDQVIDFPDLQEMIENHYSEYEGKPYFTLAVCLKTFSEGTDYGPDIGTESESTSVKTLDRTYEPEYDEMLSSERSPLPTVIPTTQVRFQKKPQ